MAITPQLDGTIEFLLGQITWTIVNSDKHFLYNKKVNWVLVCLTGRIVERIQGDTSIPIAREMRAVICGQCSAVTLLQDAGLHPYLVTQSDSLGTQSTNTVPSQSGELLRIWEVYAAVIPTCVFYLCGPDLCSCFRIVTTWFWGPHGDEWPEQVSHVKRVFFSIYCTGPFYFSSLIGWGKKRFLEMLIRIMNLYPR